MRRARPDLAPVSVAGSGASAASSAVCTRPVPELTSSQAALPSRMPTSSSPIVVSTTTEPRATSPSRTEPLADLAPTPARACSTAMSPLAALTRSSPPATPIQVSPLEFFTTAVLVELAQAHVARAGADVGVRGGVLDGDLAGAGLEVQPRGALEPMRPMPVLIRRSPSSPSVRKSVS